ncbi:MAG: MBL fold metallo-hydrolase [Bacteroidia bacterium]|nr:MBL fold metallo-hydrolase [Bacteroidia bacterium]
MTQISCKRIENSVFGSNTYILEKKNYSWLIDCGDVERILEYLKERKSKLEGIFITHSHFDHIYGINSILKNIPNVKVYLSSNGGIEIISNEKKNGSKYAEIPIEVKDANFFEVKEGDIIDLEGMKIQVIETPGHSSDSISFLIDNYIFTGDAYIPNIKVVTKLKGGNVELANTSVEKIKSLFKEKMTLCPGHGEMYNNCIKLK